ncbi:MAG: sugar ABC transporter substrate-binding protein [Oscillospiraceae bacterium]|nr:sugar ABC transporter substrate-binding protein [Oscillospiraceae bacterium]
MKKALLLILCIALATVFLVACADGAAGDDTWTIGITLQNYENPYWAGVFGHVENILTERGINFTILDSQDSAATQISQIEGFITAGVDLIMVHPSDPVAIEDVAGRAMEAGILFMSWDDVMTNSDLNWVLDNEVLGREIGTAAANFINQHYTEDNPAQVAIMNFPMTPILLDRENGIVGALEDIAGGRFEIVARQPALDAATAQSNMETILSAHPDVTIVASIGAGGDIGANEAFMLHFGGEIPDNVGIFSADATLQQLNAILNGEATRVTVGFEGSSLRTAQAVVEVYVGLLSGDNMPRNMLRVKTPMDINNAAEYIADYD